MLVVDTAQRGHHWMFQRSYWRILAAQTRIKDTLGLEWLVLESPRYFDGAAGQRVLDAVRQPIEAGVVRFAFDMAETQVVNSVGISRLIEIIQICDQKAGGVVFCTTRPILIKTFKIMGLLTKARLVACVDDLAALD